MAIGIVVIVVIVVIANTCIALKLSKRAKTSAWRVLNAMDRMFFKIFQVAHVKLLDILSHWQGKHNFETRCSRQLIADGMLSFSSTKTGDFLPLNV
jgi:hypothetical protein